MIIQKLKNIYHLIRALSANIYFGFPSKKIKIIGITGTDGKTTTTHLIYHILKTARLKVSMISTIYAKITGKEFNTGFHVTTPDAFIIPKYLKMAVDNKEEYFVLETTSHRLDQNQLFGINFEIGVLTNVTHEHLDYHQTYEKYLKAKAKLLLSSKIAIINRDDQSFKKIKEILIDKKVYTYGLSDCNVLKDLKEHIAEFNKYNYLAAYTVCKILNIPEDQISNAINTFKLPPGRLELAYDKDFKVIIDFAHTPNAIENALREIRKLYLRNGGRLIHVFGSAGLRDVTKRPLMGEASSKYADFSIITEEDYRTEDPDKICQQIVSGMKNQRYKIIIDRKEAIKQAVAMAKKNDVIVTTGKGHEQSLCRGKNEYPWDEKKAILAALKLYDYL